MCMHSMRKPAISSYLKWCQVRVNKMETWALSRYYTIFWPSSKHRIEFLPHPAGGEAVSRVGPKIALDHVRVYKKKLCLCDWVSSPLVVYDAIDNASSSRATRTEKWQQSVSPCSQLVRAWQPRKTETESLDHTL